MQTAIVRFYFPMSCPKFQVNSTSLIGDEICRVKWRPLIPPECLEEIFSSGLCMRPRLFCNSWQLATRRRQAYWCIRCRWSSSIQSWQTTAREGVIPMLLFASSSSFCHSHYRQRKHHVEQKLHWRTRLSIMCARWGGVGGVANLYFFSISLVLILIPAGFWLSKHANSIAFKQR